jgi:crotonobetainyl-CoA:carnitine CoA-transferase CaiB-like acyl-CoA transferase
MSQVIERPDLASAEVYATPPDRIRRRDELFAILGGAFAQKPWSHWQARMRAAGVPCGQVRTVGEAIRSPEARERKLVTRIPHPATGWVPNVRLPIRYSRTPVADPVAAPAVGQHTGEVIREILGYDEGRLARLAEAGAFGPPAPEQARAKS